MSAGVRPALRADPPAQRVGHLALRAGNLAGRIPSGGGSTGMSPARWEISPRMSRTSMQNGVAA